MFTRWANSLFIHWRQGRSNARHLTTTDFMTHLWLKITTAAPSVPSAPAASLDEDAVRQTAGSWTARRIERAGVTT